MFLCFQTKLSILNIMIKIKVIYSEVKKVEATTEGKKLLEKGGKNEVIKGRWK